jgi:DNA-binding HxlR family transcriptional regulator
LTDLEEAGVLEREVIGGRPPHVEYRLTARGRQLRTLINALARFAATG